MEDLIQESTIQIIIKIGKGIDKELIADIFKPGGLVFLFNR